MSQKPAAQWLKEFGELGIPCGPVNRIDQVLGRPPGPTPPSPRRCPPLPSRQHPGSKLPPKILPHPQLPPKRSPRPGPTQRNSPPNPRRLRRREGGKAKGGGSDRGGGVRAGGPSSRSLLDMLHTKLPARHQEMGHRPTFLACQVAAHQRQPKRVRKCRWSVSRNRGDTNKSGPRHNRYLRLPSVLCVIIENQLEYSDGDHLSRILIYAAGKDADVIVWIAKEFEEEHWLVLQWLNQRTEATTKFFGVAIEVWSIDDSPPAPHFRVVAAPNDWRKQNISERRSAAPREMGKKYYGFRSSLRDKLDGEVDLPKVRKTENSNPWLVLASADGLRYAVDFRDKIYVSLQMDTSGSDNRLNLEQCHAVFDRLEEDRETFESALGPLEWKREWGRERGSQIASHYPEKFQDALDSWDEIHSWIISTYRKFREAFEPYRQELRRIAAEASGSPE